MATGKPTAAETGVPDGYSAIPLLGAQDKGALKLCVLTRKTPDPVGGNFVLLRELHDARVFLGCVTDAAGQVREWLELWVQNTDGLEASLPAYREAFSNFALDSRWSNQAQAFRSLRPGSALVTGWEDKHPSPLFIDLSRTAGVVPKTEPGGEWNLCQDDKALEGAGLPGYSTSLARYLFQPGGNGQGKFIPVTSGAPENASTAALAKAAPDTSHFLPLNPQGGLMMATGLFPIPYEDYADVLSGKSWPGLEHGKKTLQLDGVYRGLADWSQAQQDSAHLFLGAYGKAGRFLETFHLKLQLFTNAVRDAHSFIQQQQLPLLNLSAESFRVRLEDIGSGLPILWTAKCALVRPGNAFELPVPSTEFRYFIRPGTARPSIYLPEGLTGHLQSSGNVRIRKVLPPDQGQTVLEGTMVVQERLAVSKHDLLWIRLPLPNERLDLYGHVYAAESLAQGEIRFRTVPQRLSEAQMASLKAAEGVSFARSPFEIVPLLSSPCDLYSLGVLGVRTFLVDEKTTLPIALDEVLSLARQLAAETEASSSVGQRVQGLVERDPRYAASLGREHLARETSPELAAVLPANLWWDTLSVLARFFPGIGPDSFCRDYGDVPALALETVFNKALEELEKLLVRSRSLLLLDWKANQEIRSTISSLLKK